MNDPVQELLEKLAQARVEVASAAKAMDAGGWEAHQVNPENMIGPVVYLYVRDKPTGWMWMCSVPIDSFQKLANQVQVTPEIWDSVRGGAAFWLRQIAMGQQLPGWEDKLGMFLGAYAGTTQTYQAAGRFQSGGHLLIANYRRPNEIDGRLRPFAAKGDGNTPLPVDEVRGALDNVERMDKARHPEWF